MTTDIIPPNSTQFYTYVHTRNDTGAIFYVGKGTVKRKRAWDKFGHNLHWKRVVDKCGYTVTIVAHFAREKDALDYEMELIAKCRADGVPLTNQTNGGEGASGYKHTAESLAKMSAALKGKKPFLGRVHSEETLAKLRGNKNGLGHVHTPETRAKISAARKSQKTGSKRSIETRAKMSAARAGRAISAEQRTKISNSMLGRKHTAETCYKMVLAAQRRKERRMQCPA